MKNHSLTLMLFQTYIYFFFFGTQNNVFWRVLATKEFCHFSFWNDMMVSKRWQNFHFWSEIISIPLSFLHCQSDVVDPQRPYTVSLSLPPALHFWLFHFSHTLAVAVLRQASPDTKIRKICHLLIPCFVLHAVPFQLPLATKRKQMIEFSATTP